MNKKNKIILIVSILLLGLLIFAGTMSFWTWTSNVPKNVVFTTANLKNYIVYDEGESTFSGAFEPSSSYLTKSIHSTIGINKTSGASNINLVATIKLTVNDIGTNIATSSALKWVITRGDSETPGAVLGQGTFYGVNSGRTLTLLSSEEVTQEQKKFTVWIWLDESENPSSSLSDETLDVSVWTQIDQIES